MAQINLGKVRGDNGLSAYIKYNTVPTDAGATDTWSPGQRYLGVATSNTGAPTEGYVWSEFISDDVAKKASGNIPSRTNPNDNRQMLEFTISSLNSLDAYGRYSFMLVSFGTNDDTISNNSVIIPLQWFRNSMSDDSWQGTYCLNNTPYAANFTVYRDQTYLVLQLKTFSSTVSVDLRYCIFF